MACGWKYDPVLECKNSNDLNEDTLAFGACTRTTGGKRVVVLNCAGVPSISSVRCTVAKRYGMQINQKSLLESLPEDILVRVLCGVDHKDLNRLILVSKTICEATVIAKRWHFAFTTPTKKIPGVKTFIDSEDASKFDYREAPFAPMQQLRTRRRFIGPRLADITVALFASPRE